MKRIFPFILLTFLIGSIISFPSGFVGQNSEKSLLEKINNTPNTDTVKLKYLNELAYFYLTTGKYDLAEKYCIQIGDLAKKLNSKKGIEIYEYAYACLHMAKGETEKVEPFVTKMEVFFKPENILTSKVHQKFKVLSLIGQFYDQKDKLSKSLHYYSLALTEGIVTNDSLDLASLYNNIAIVYQKNDNYEEALKFQSKAIKIKENAGSSDYSLGISYFNMASTYSELNQYDNALKTLNTSIEYASKAEDPLGVGLCNTMKGNTYFKMAKGNLKNVGSESSTTDFLLNSEKYHIEAITIFLEIDQEYYAKHSYLGLADVYKERLKFDAAIDLYKKAYNIAEGDNLTTAASSAYGLYESYKNKNNFKEALHWLEINDSCLKELNDLDSKAEIAKHQAAIEYKEIQIIDSLKHINEIQVKDAFIKQEKIVNEEKISKRNYIIFSSFLMVLVIMVFAVIIYKRFIISKKQNAIIIAQKGIIEQEKKATQDSIIYANYIQQASFPSQKLVQQYFEKSFLVFMPKDIVSGDFYWTFQKNNKKYLLIGDCTGHGVPGAFMTLICLSILSEIATDGFENAADLVNQLNSGLYNRLNHENEYANKFGLEVSVIEVIKDSNTVLYCGSKQKMYHYQAHTGMVETYKGNRVILGSAQPLDCKIDEVNCTNGDVLFLMTDGFSDQKGGPNGEKIYHEDVLKILAEIGQVPFDKRESLINNKITTWKGNQHQIDDITICGIEF